MNANNHANPQGDTDPQAPQAPEPPVEPGVYPAEPDRRQDQEQPGEDIPGEQPRSRSNEGDPLNTPD